MTPEMLKEMSLAELLESLMLSDSVDQDKKEILRSALANIRGKEEKTSEQIVIINGIEYDPYDIKDIYWSDPPGYVETNYESFLAAKELDIETTDDETHVVKVKFMEQDSYKRLCQWVYFISKHDIYLDMPKAPIERRKHIVDLVMSDTNLLEEVCWSGYSPNTDLECQWEALNKAEEYYIDFLGKRLWLTRDDFTKDAWNTLKKFIAIKRPKEQIESLLLSDNITSEKKEIIRSSLSEMLSQQAKAERKKWLEGYSLKKTHEVLVEIGGNEYDLANFVRIEWDSDGTREGFFDADEWTLYFADDSYVTCEPQELPSEARDLLEEYADDSCIWEYGDRGVVIDGEFYCLRHDIGSISWNGKKDEEDLDSYYNARLLYFETNYHNVLVVFKNEIESHWLDDVERKIGLW